MDILIFTALTEEHQVVSSIMDDLAVFTNDDQGVRIYEFVTPHGTRFKIGICSAHLQGASTLSAVATRQLAEYRPKVAALLGIAAVVDTRSLALGDVPFATHIVGTEDIAVENGTLTFRSEGFQCDSRFRSAIGSLRSDQSIYQSWQLDCLLGLPPLIYRLNSMRRTKVVHPGNLCAPHILAGNVSGTPFLIRDASFRSILSTTDPELDSTDIRVTNPLHPKLISTEMESHGFMRAATELQTPAIVLKGISDDGDSRKPILEKQTGGFYRAFATSNALRALLRALDFARLPEPFATPPM